MAQVGLGLGLVTQVRVGMVSVGMVIVGIVRVGMVTCTRCQGPALTKDRPVQCSNNFTAAVLHY